MSLKREMRAFLAAHPEEPADALARSFLRAHEIDDLVPLVAEEFAHMRRSGVRQLERLASVLGRTRASRPITRADTNRLLSELAPILVSSYAVGNGVLRRGAEMTEQDWLARAAMLRGQLAGLARAIAVCERSVELIRAYGVGTLGEINGVAAAA